MFLSMVMEIMENIITLISFGLKEQPHEGLDSRVVGA
jgi:hypothetical protein